MTFQQFEYVRPDLKRFEELFNGLLQRFAGAATFEEQDQAMEAINAARSDIESMMTIARIRYTLNTADPFYKAEQEYLDESSPLYQGLITSYYKALIESSFRNQLEAKWGRQLFAIAELELKTFAPTIIEDLQEENKTASEYIKLVASAKISFEGEERTLSQLSPFMQSLDRDMRKRATDARYSFFETNEAEIDNIYDRLVKLRTGMAHKLGYRNFIELAYARLGRTDYNADKVALFRKQVLEHIVPVATKLSERRRIRLGLDKLRYYDGLSYLSGNPTPKGDSVWIVDQAERMYAEMAPERRI